MCCAARAWSVAERRIVSFAMMMFRAGSRPGRPNPERQSNQDPDTFTNSSQNPHYNLTASHQTDNPGLVHATTTPVVGASSSCRHFRHRDARAVGAARRVWLAHGAARTGDRAGPARSTPRPNGGSRDCGTRTESCQTPNGCCATRSPVVHRCQKAPLWSRSNAIASSRCRKAAFPTTPSRRRWHTRLQIGSRRWTLPNTRRTIERLPENWQVSSPGLLILLYGQQRSFDSRARSEPVVT